MTARMDPAEAKIFNDLFDLEEREAPTDRRRRRIETVARWAWRLFLAAGYAAIVVRALT